MNLRSKTLLAFSATLVVLVSGLSLALSTLLFKNLKQAEEHEAKQAISQVLDFMDYDLEGIDLRCYDYAAWDDTYRFIQDQNEQYLESNFPEGQLASIDINIVVFMDPNGKIIHSLNYNPANGDTSDISQSLKKYLSANRMHLSHQDPLGSRFGIIATPENKLLISSRPIVTSTEEGPIGGTLIFGRHLFPDQNNRIKRLSKYPAFFSRIDDTNLPQDDREQISALIASSDLEAISFRPLSENTIAAYSLLRDILGKPTLLLKIEIPRTIYLDGKRGIYYLVGALVFVEFIFAIIILIFLEKLVLDRLMRLSATVMQIGDQKSLSTRLRIPGRDELSNLAQTINKMLDALEISHTKLEREASYDSLTGLTNRAFFTLRLKKAIDNTEFNSNPLFAVLFLDLDGFKVVNDSLGHHIGDQVLVSVAHRLKQCLRSEDVVSRLGGDEFAILLENLTEINNATKVAEKILFELSIPIQIEQYQIFSSTSIGIVLGSNFGQEASDILRDGDTAMYQAKSLGKSCYQIFDEQMQCKAKQRLKLEIDLRSSLEREDFFLCYQPIFSLSNHRIIGFEALVRWQHPQEGILSPSAFIPMCEETGLIIPLGWWILREACHQMKNWRQQYPYLLPSTIHINFSPKQFGQSNLVEKVEQILNETDLPPSALKIEITESILLANSKQNKMTLNQLKQLGVQLSLDDFGVGYSALSYLRSFPIDELKIDRSFVNGLNESAEDKEIIRAMITLAHNLGINVIAEGIETVEQLSQLQDLSCDFGQGYYFSKPETSEAIVAIFMCDCPKRSLTI